MSNGNRERFLAPLILQKGEETPRTQRICGWILKNAQLLGKVSSFEDASTDDENHFAMLLPYICEYVGQFQLLPTYRSLRDWLLTEKDKTEIPLEALQNLPTFIQEAEYPADLSLEELLPVFRSYLEEVRADWYRYRLKQTAQIAVAGMEINKKLVKGVDAAKAQHFKYLSEDISLAPQRVEGTMHENADKIYAGLLEYGSEAKNKRRALTGLRQLDTHPLLIEIGMFVGILAHANMGKTTLLSTLIYNWAKQGLNILYVSLEHDPETSWHKIAYLHSDWFEQEFQLPSWSDWVMGKRTPEDVANIRKIVADIQEQQGIPGVIDCRQFFTWPEIKAHLLANDDIYQYDILVVDYLAKLKVNSKYRDEAIDEIISDAYVLSRSHRNGNGLLVVTPIQTNREGKKEAEEGNGEYELTAIRQHTVYERDMDIILTLFTNDHMKRVNQMNIKTVKIRDQLGQGNVPLFTAHRNPRTNLIGGNEPVARDIIPADIMDEV